jgi:hypothetical protein
MPGVREARVQETPNYVGRRRRFPVGGEVIDGRIDFSRLGAKVADWVATLRRGKAVEINALWYNALPGENGGIKKAGRP